jgi:hypothetical protein
MTAGWRSIRNAAITWVVLSLLMAAWAVATPIAAAPDEPAHLIKAASVVRGQFIGTRGPDGDIVQVPAYIAFTQAQTCYAFKPDVDASCIPGVTGDPDALVDATTTAGLYNPLYYLLVGWPSLIWGDSGGIFAMRIVSGVVTALFLAAAIGVIGSIRRRWLPLLGAAAAATPMVLFLGGTVNPNGLETTATLAVFTALMAIAVDPSPRLVAPRAGVVAVAGAVAANARGLSLAWLALAVAIPLIVMGWVQVRALLRERSVIVAIAVVGGATLFAASWLLSTNSLSAAIGKPSLVEIPYLGSSPFVGFALTIEQTFGLAMNMVGIFGWLDAPAPTAVMFVWAAFSGTLILLSVALLRRRALVAIITSGLALVLFPAIFQAVYIRGGGFIWQGRYSLPLFVCLLVGMAILLAEALPAVTSVTVRRVVVFVAGVWAVAQIYSFASALKRYVVGDGGWDDFFLHPEWVPPGGVLLLVAAFAVFAVAAAVLLAVHALSEPAVGAAPSEAPVTAAQHRGRVAR